jgi:hypothetical protein
MVPHRSDTRNTLVAALSACTDLTVRTRVRRFLSGLSSDELEFLAAFLGSCIVESSEDTRRAVEEVEAHQSRMARASLRRSDHENKMILLREFLNVNGPGRGSVRKPHPAGESTPNRYPSSPRSRSGA